MRRYLIILILVPALFTGCVGEQALRRAEDPLAQAPCIDGVDAGAFQSAAGTLNKKAPDPAGSSAKQFYLRGVAFYCSGKHARAMVELKLALGLDASYYDALMLKATVHNETGNIEIALKDLATASRSKPKAPAPYIGLGNIHLQMGDLSKASDDFVNAIKRSPRSDVAHVGIAEIYAMQGRLEDALNFYDRALKFNPASALAYASRGITFFDFGEYENAALDLERAGGLAPELSVRLAESRGYANFYIAKYEKAAEAFSEFIASEPLPPVDIVTMRALSYFYAGELDRAISDATKAIELAPDDPKLYYNRANFHV
ncbi:hypothetical protein LCGC14_2419160, partial [marine sediment metagenome]